MSQVPSVLRYWWPAPAGAYVAACSRRCQAAVAAASPLPAVPPGSDDAFDADLEEPLTVLWPFGGCAHCAWCGRVASVPGNGCLLHELACPRFRWEFTVCGRRAVTLVRRHTGVGTFTPRALAAFTEVAALLDEAGQFPDVDALVAGVLDRGVDWLP